MLTLTHTFWLRRLCLGLFVASTMFPIAASVSSDVPGWLGFVDVAFAGLLVASAIALIAQTQKRATDEDRLVAFRVSQVIMCTIPALLFVFFTAGRLINWNVLIIGLAWRGWLLSYSLPYLIAAQRTGP